MFITKTDENILIGNKNNELNMDSLHYREGLHLWITSKKEKKVKKKIRGKMKRITELEETYLSVVLTRGQCRILMKEIEHRLF